MKSITKKIATGLLIVAAPLSACNKGTPINTPSGNPEITVSNVRLDCIRGDFMNMAVNGGFTIRQSSDLQLVLGRITKNTLATVFLSSDFGGAPEERIFINFIPLPSANSYRIVVTEGYVTNPGTGFEKLTPASSTGEVQAQFSAKKSYWEALCKS